MKGIERFLGAVETLEQSLIEVTSGQAKYEHQHRAIVWRMSRLPKEGQGNHHHIIGSYSFISVMVCVFLLWIFMVSLHLTDHQNTCKAGSNFPCLTFIKKIQVHHKIDKKCNMTQQDTGRYRTYNALYNHYLLKHTHYRMIQKSQCPCKNKFCKWE